jgi:hypothetical protein
MTFLYNEGSGGAIFWNLVSFGADQEAYITIATLGQSGSEQTCS